MFICRQHLLRASKPRYFTTPSPAPRYLTTSGPPRTPSTDVRRRRISSDTSAPTNRAETGTTTTVRSQTTNTLQSRKETSELPHPPPRQTKSNKKKASNELPVPKARDLPNITLKASANKALDGLRKALDERDRYAVSRAMEFVFEERVKDPNGYTALLQQTLDILSNSTYSHRRAILETLRTLYSEDPTLELPFALLARLTNQFLSIRSEPSVDAPALAMLAPVITNYVLRVHKDHRLVCKPYTLSRILWTHFKVLVKLAESPQNKIALSSLRQLVQYGIVPSSALEGIDLKGRNFGAVFFSIIIRCCLSFGWPNRATFLLNASVNWDNHAPTSFGPAVASVIDALIQDNTSSTSLHNAAGLITRYHTFLTAPFPRRILQLFYDKTQADHHDGMALTVYQVLRSPDVRSRHKGPTLNGKTLTWLLYRCRARKDIHTMRSLIAQVVEEGVGVSEPYLPSFVQSAAEYGMFYYARKLWERAEATGNTVVLREPAILTRLVSITEARIRNRLQHLQESKQSSNATATSDSVPHHSNNLASSTSLPADVAQEDINTPPSSDDDHFVETGDEDDHGTMSYQEQIDDYRAFADTVISTYVRYNHPLRDATREQLNALARAYIIRGKPQDGMRVLQIILDRHEAPDLHDINVALSAVSIKDPAAGAQMIERMASLGLKPDGVSFGTVINCAAEQGDMALVLKLIARARQAGIPQLDYKTIGKLIRTFLTSSARDSRSRWSCLQNVKILVDSLLDAGYTPSPNMGLDCVEVALRAGAPVKAYYFWEQLVKTKVQWDDETQALHRARIALRLGKRLAKGLLEPEAAHRMLSDLGFSSFGSSGAIFPNKPPAAAGPAQQKRRTTGSKGPEQ